jgi:hypothetical protein
MGNRLGGLNNYTGVLTQQKCVTTSADIAFFPDFRIKSLGFQTGIVIPVLPDFQNSIYLRQDLHLLVLNRPNATI